MTEAFRDFAAQLGFELPQNIQPGRRFRFSTNGKRGDEAGWGYLFPDGLGGVVGDWRTGQQEVWQAKRDRIFTAEEKRAWREKIEREAREARAEKDKAEAEAAARATDTWNSSQPAPVDHPYLKAKGVEPYGLRIYGGERLVIGGVDCSGALILPLSNAARQIRTLEFICPNGEKRFLPRGSYSGCYFAIGKPGEVVAICEGFATGASIHKATGLPVRIAATAGNLLDVAKAIRERAPSNKLVICGDRDESGTGQKYAQEAADAVGGYVALPEANEDFNDLYRTKGPDAVARGVLSVMSVPTPGHSPEPLPELPPVPPFNFDVLPPKLRALVQDIAERMQCPPEFVAVSALVMMGAAIGRRCGIRPKRHDAWTVIANVWGAIVGKPGSMKSPAIAEAIAALKRMQAKAFEEFEQSMAEYEIEEKASKIKAGDAERRARKALEKDGMANVAAYLTPEARLIEPKLKRYVVNDSSPEALCETLKDNPNGVLVERDELVGLLRSMDREGNQEARALYMTAADGDKSFTVDRIMRGSGRHIPGLCVSILGGIQPGVLAGYVRETQRGGAGDDGLLQRFGLMVYPDVTGKWRNVDRMPDGEAKRAVYEIVEHLCNLTPEVVGAEVDEHSEIPFLRFDDAAQPLFVEWQTDLEERLRNGDDHPAIVSHLAKYRKLVPALALINHLCDGGKGPVSEAALGRALLFIEFLEAHARRVYSYAARPDLDAAKTILAKLRTGKLPIQFPARDVYRSGWSGLTTPEEAYAALRVLCDFGWLTESTNTATGGKPSTTYRAHSSTKGAS